MKRSCCSAAVTSASGQIAGGSANRWKNNSIPILFLLDDGLQHAKLHRAVNVLLLDDIDPLAGRRCLSAGSIEGAVESAMERASVIVITRAGRRRFLDGLPAPAPQAPVFLADVE